MKNKFIDKCVEFNGISNKLYSKVDELSDKLILRDLSNYFEKDFKNGFNTLDGCNYVNEIRVDDGIFTICNKITETYKGYRLHFKDEFNLPHLGFYYKGEVISPHINNEPGELIKKYNDSELSEIIVEIDKRITLIQKDLSEIQVAEPDTFSFFYREYNGMFDGHEFYKNFTDVIEDFKIMQDKK